MTTRQRRQSSALVFFWATTMVLELPCLVTTTTTQPRDKPVRTLLKRRYAAHHHLQQQQQQQQQEQQQHPPHHDRDHEHEKATIDLANDSMDKESNIEEKEDDEHDYEDEEDTSPSSSSSSSSSLEDENLNPPTPQDWDVWTYALDIQDNEEDCRDEIASVLNCTQVYELGFCDPHYQDAEVEDVHLYCPVTCQQCPSKHLPDDHRDRHSPSSSTSSSSSFSMPRTTSVTVDMECYEAGQDIRVRFTNAQPESMDWIGIFPAYLLDHLSNDNTAADKSHDHDQHSQLRPTNGDDDSSSSSSSSQPMLTTMTTTTTTATISNNSKTPVPVPEMWLYACGYLEEHCASAVGGLVFGSRGPSPNIQWSYYPLEAGLYRAALVRGYHHHDDNDNDKENLSDGTATTSSSEEKMQLLAQSPTFAAKEWGESCHSECHQDTLSTSDYCYDQGEWIHLIIQNCMPRESDRIVLYQIDKNNNDNNIDESSASFSVFDTRTHEPFLWMGACGKEDCKGIATPHQPVHTTVSIGRHLAALQNKRISKGEGGGDEFDNTMWPLPQGHYVAVLMRFDDETLINEAPHGRPIAHTSTFEVVAGGGSCYKDEDEL